MDYKFDFAMSATLSEKVVSEMVKHAVETQTGRTVSHVKFTNRTVSDPMDRYSTTEFSGAVVTFDTTKPN